MRVPRFLLAVLHHARVCLLLRSRLRPFSPLLLSYNAPSRLQGYLTRFVHPSNNTYKWDRVWNRVMLLQNIESILLLVSNHLQHGLDRIVGDGEPYFLPRSTSVDALLGGSETFSIMIMSATFVINPDLALQCL